MVYPVNWTIHEREFRFQELLAHLNAYKAPKVVAIGEEATRVISRVEYDNETDKLLGFILPCNTQGLSLGDYFIAVTFASMEESFRTAEVAKYRICINGTASMPKGSRFLLGMYGYKQ